MSRAWMPIYWGDYLADTRHLETVEDGAYLLLIAHYWQHGGLPKDERVLQKIVKFSRYRWLKHRKVLRKLFGPGWTHKRIDAELEKAELIRTKRKLAGQRGGMKTHGYSRRAIALAQANAQARAKQMGYQSQSPKIKKEGEAEKVDVDKPNGPDKPGVSGSSELGEIIKIRGWA